jgi:hypothetical protein
MRMAGVSRARSGAVVIALLVGILALPAQLHAQDRLRVPTTVFAAAAAADWASTYHALKHYRLRESNPLLKSLDDQPAKLVAIGAAIDVGAVIVWNTGVGRNHPRLAATGLWTMAAYRAYLAIHNLRNARRAERRERPH